MPGLCVASRLRRCARRDRRLSFRAFERNADAVAEDRLDGLALERAAAAVGYLSGHAVQVDGLLTGEQLARDAAGVDAESVKTAVARWKVPRGADTPSPRVIGLDQPGHVHEADAVEVPV